MNFNTSTTVCCPKCESGHIHRMRRPVLVKHLLSFVPLRRYRCLSCLTTFAAPVTIKSEKPAPVLLVPIVNLSQRFQKQPLHN